MFYTASGLTSCPQPKTTPRRSIRTKRVSRRAKSQSVLVTHLRKRIEMREMLQLNERARATKIQVSSLAEARPRPEGGQRERAGQAWHGSELALPRMMAAACSRVGVGVVRQPVTARVAPAPGRSPTRRTLHPC